MKNNNILGAEAIMAIFGCHRVTKFCGDCRFLYSPCFSRKKGIRRIKKGRPGEARREYMCLKGERRKVNPSDLVCKYFRKTN